MTKTLLLSLLLIFNGKHTTLPLSGQTESPLPKTAILKTYKQYLSYCECPVSLRENTISKLNDASLQQLKPGYSFYNMEIFNGCHWEYNNGTIQTIAAVNMKDSNDIWLLMPMDYCNKSAELLKLFINTEISDKEAACKAMAGLLMKTKTQNLDCCDKELKDISHSAKMQGEELTITTQYTLYCCDGWVRTNKSKMKDYTENVETKFVFKNNLLIEINTSDWKK